MRKNLFPILILAAFAVLLGIYLGYNVFGERDEINPPVPQKDTRIRETPNERSSADKKGETLAKSDTSKEPPVSGETPVKTTKIEDTDPTKGEFFVEGQVKSIDMEKRIITIDQHMDDNSVVINPNVPVIKDAILHTKDKKTGKEYDISFTDIRNGDLVAFILTKEGMARAVLVNF